MCTHTNAHTCIGHAHTYGIMGWLDISQYILYTQRNAKEAQKCCIPDVVF